MSTNFRALCYYLRMSFPRKTSISWVEDGDIKIRGHRIEDLIGKKTLGEVLFLLLTGKMASDEYARMFEAILVSVVDHGVRPPSTIATTTVANTGAELNASVAAGVLAINKYHGGAIEKSMAAISEAVSLQEQGAMDKIQAAEEIVSRYRSENKRVSGFGHRHHRSDPRTLKLFKMARDLGIAGKHVEQTEALEEVLSKKFGKNLPINADGAIAALLCEMDFSPRIANGIFMIARVPGLVAHAVEEQENHPPLRSVDVDNYEFE